MTLSKIGSCFLEEVKLLLGRENVLFADTALDLTDDVTSMLDVAANGADKK